MDGAGHVLCRALTHVCAEARNQRSCAPLTHACGWQRFYLVPLYLYPSWHTLACQMLCDAVGGAYLGVNFIISHNYEGVRTVLADADRSKHVKRDWAFEQVSLALEERLCSATCLAVVLVLQPLLLAARVVPQALMYVGRA